MKLFNGLEYLMIDVMNNIGFDKETYEMRLSKFREMIQVKAEMSNQEIAEYVNGLDVEEPELVFCGLLAYRDFLNKKESGYMVSFDATASGIQIMSAITSDEIGMLGTNLLDENNRYDVYTMMYEMMNGTASRKEVKSSVMVMMYGGDKSAKEAIGSEEAYYQLKEICKEKMPRVFGLRELLMGLGEYGYEDWEWRTPDCFKCYVANEVMFYEERDVNGKSIQVKYKDIAFDKNFKGQSANFIHSLDGFVMREVLGRCNYSVKRVQKVLNHIESVKKMGLNSIGRFSKKMLDDGLNKQLEELVEYYEKSKFMTVRNFSLVRNLRDVVQLFITGGLEYLDALEKLGKKMLSGKSFEVICIHDCYKALPNNMNYVRYWYNYVLYELSMSDAVSVMLDEYSQGVLSDLPFMRRVELLEKVKTANYAIC